MKKTFSNPFIALFLLGMISILSCSFQMSILQPANNLSSNDQAEDLPIYSALSNPVALTADPYACKNGDFAAQFIVCDLKDGSYGHTISFEVGLSQEQKLSVIKAMGHAIKNMHQEYGIIPDQGKVFEDVKRM